MSRVCVSVERFESLGDPAECEHFARGMTDDLATELRRFPALSVVNAVDRGRSESPSFVLRGTVRRSHDRLRVSAQLIESQSGEQVWGERFESRDADPLSVQDEIASAVAGTIASRIDRLRLTRARRAPITSLAAYDCWLRGKECLVQGSVDADAEARSYFERALEIDPHYPRALAGLSLAHYNDWSCQSWHLWNEGEQLACRFAEKAVALDDGDAFVHVVLGRVRLYERKFDAAEQCFARALALNSNDPDVLAHVALWTFYLGDPRESVRLVERAMDADPHHADWLYGVRGLARFSLEQFADAQVDLAKAGSAFVDLPAFRSAAALLAGDQANAERQLDQFRADYTLKINFGRTPEPGEPMSWLTTVNPFRKSDDLNRLLAALGRLGLEHAAANGASRPEPRAADLQCAGNEFRRDADTKIWSLAYSGVGARLAEVKGFHDIAALLRHPALPVHCLQLVGAPADEGADAVLDPDAKRSYEERVRDLREEIADAEQRSDADGASKAQAELEEIAQELASAFGLGGRSRKLGHPAERARHAVTWRIRSAIKKIAAAHPRLGLHLANSIRTGTCCSYEPEQQTAWGL